MPEQVTLLGCSVNTELWFTHCQKQLSFMDIKQATHKITQKYKKHSSGLKYNKLQANLKPVLLYSINQHQSSFIHQSDLLFS